MKIVHERETQRNKKQRHKIPGGTEAIAKIWELNYFVVHLS